MSAALHILQSEDHVAAFDLQPGSHLLGIGEDADLVLSDAHAKADLCYVEVTPEHQVTLLALPNVPLRSPHREASAEMIVAEGRFVEVLGPTITLLRTSDLGDVQVDPPRSVPVTAKSIAHEHVSAWHAEVVQKADGLWLTVSHDEHRPCSHRSVDRRDEHTPCSHRSVDRRDQHTPCSHPSVDRRDEHGPCSHRSVHRRDEHTPSCHRSVHRHDEHTPSCHRSVHRRDEHGPSCHLSVRRRDEHGPCSHPSVDRRDEHGPCSHPSVTPRSPLGHPSVALRSIDVTNTRRFVTSV